MNRRDRFERDLQRLLEEEGVHPPDEEIAEVVDFFDRWGPSALPMLRRAGEAMVREHQEHQRETTRRPPGTTK